MRSVKRRVAMLPGLPSDLVCFVISRLGAADLRHVLCVCREARTHVIDAIYNISHRCGWEEAIDDYTPHGLLGMEMATALRAVICHAPERLDALENCVEFQLYRPTLGQLHEDRGSVLWHNGDDVVSAPTSSFLDEVLDSSHPSPQTGWEDSVLIDNETMDFLCRGDERGFARLTDLRPQLLHTRGNPRVMRVFTKAVHESTEVLHACMVHVRSAALLASLACDVEDRS